MASRIWWRGQGGVSGVPGGPAILSRINAPTPLRPVVPVRNEDGIETYLALNEVADTGLGHDGDSNGLHDLLDHAGVRHAGNATLDTDIGGDTLEGHDGGGTGLLSNASLQIE